MDTSIHNVTSIKVRKPEHFFDSAESADTRKGGFWTREIVIRTKEGHSFELTLYAQNEDKEGLEITL